MDELLRDMILGALLHDIGKAIQRASPNPKAKRHQEFGAEWLDQLPHEVKDSLKPAKNFILRHHRLHPNDPKYADLDIFAKGFEGDLAIVWEADNLASGERYKEDPDEIGGEEIQFDSMLPLYSIFNRISYRKKSSQQTFLAYPAKDLETHPLNFPDQPKNLTKEDYGHLVKAFTDRLTTLPQAQNPLQYLLNLMECYFSFIPSETAFRADVSETYPDISLFDHSKMTAAIASAMYLYFRDEKGKKPGELGRDEIEDRSEPRYLLVSGDFSGIQDFIYTVTYRAALKGLRARSFYLELLGEHFVHTLLEKLGLSRTQLLYMGGGSFYLLLPNTRKAKEILSRRTQEFNQWLLKEHDCILFLAIGSVELNGQSFVLSRDSRRRSYPTISEAWQQVRRHQDEEKRRKFHDLLSENFFSPYTGKGAPCGVCQKVTEKGKEFFNEETGETYYICYDCNSLIRLGKELPKAKFIEVFESPPETPAVLIEKRWYTPVMAKTDRGSLALVTRYVLNSFLEDAIPLLVGNYPGESVEFGEIAEAALGSPYLATFRADVDNLGTIFSVGIPEPARSISRLATLSRFLTLFFKYGINEIAEGRVPEDFHSLPTPERKRQLVIVYSGGDDLFVTGAWSDVVEFAFEVRRAFQKFVAQNPEITLSGGIILAPPKFPIYRMAQSAGEAEDRAKAVKKNGKEKNGLSLFTLTKTWEEWENILQQVLVPLLKLGKFEGNRFHPRFSRSLIYKLLALVNQTKKETQESTDPDKWDKEMLMLPRVLYVLGRTKPKLESEEQERAWEQFTGPAVSKNKEEAIQWLRNLPGPLTWLDYLMRGGEAS